MLSWLLGYLIGTQVRFRCMHWFRPIFWHSWRFPVSSYSKQRAQFVEQSLLHRKQYAATVLSSDAIEASSIVLFAFRRLRCWRKTAVLFSFFAILLLPLFPLEASPKWVWDWMCGLSASNDLLDCRNCWNWQDTSFTYAGNWCRGFARKHGYVGHRPS